jgi:hypothetical protein
MDFLFAGLVVIFFLSCLALVAGLDHLREH